MIDLIEKKQYNIDYAVDWGYGETRPQAIKRHQLNIDNIEHAVKNNSEQWLQYHLWALVVKPLKFTIT